MKWLLGALTLLVAGIILKLGLLVYAMYVLLGVLLLSRYLSRQWVENLSATRHCSADSAQVGESIEVIVTVSNHGKLPVPWLLLEDSLPRAALTQNPPRIRAKGPRLSITRLSPGGEKSLRYQINFLMRGYYQIGPLLLESGDLFGLHRRYRVVTEPHFVLVYPKVVPLEGYDLASRRPIGDVRLTHRLFEDPTRINGVRPYQDGDPLNRIHWRATARIGQLQSKSYEPSCVAGITILLDFHQDSFHAPGELYRAELAITTVASLANTVHQLRQPVGFVTNGRDAADRIREEGWGHEFLTRSAARTNVAMRERSDRLQPLIIETRRRPDQLMQILETFARVELTDGLTFPQLLVEIDGRLPRNTTAVAVLTEVSEETAVALGNLHRRGYAVTAILVVFDEAETPDWAQRPDWANWLLAAGIDVRRVDNEATLARLCAEQLYRRA